MKIAIVGLGYVGLPLSLQIMGRTFAEDMVFRVSRTFEREVKWSVAPTFLGVGGEAGAV